MAELIDALQTVVKNYVNNMELTDLAYATVSSVSPLGVIIEGTIQEIPEAMLILTDAVKPKTLQITGHIHNITTLTHNHTATASATEGTVTVTVDNALTNSYPTEISQDTIICLENGVQLPSTQATVTINRGLVVGDRVIVLRVLGGQNLLILSKV